MCTLSIIATDDTSAYRLVCNRDEQRTRPPAIAPAWRDLRPGLRACWPTDTQAGGTWIGVRDDGLSLCLLNLNEPGLSRPPAGRATSRGMVIPSVIAAPDANAVAASLARLDLNAFAPFRLILAQSVPGEILCREFRWDRARLTHRNHRANAICFTSSGLGDDLVTPRLKLFKDLVPAHAPSAHHQDAFHNHAWHDRPETSVLMSRDDARTVSVITVEFTGVPHTGVSMCYRPVSEPAAARATA